MLWFKGMIDCLVIYITTGEANDNINDVQGSDAKNVEDSASPPSANIETKVETKSKLKSN